MSDEVIQVLCLQLGLSLPSELRLLGDEELCRLPKSVARTLFDLNRVEGQRKKLVGGVRGAMKITDVDAVDNCAAALPQPAFGHPMPSGPGPLSLPLTLARALPDVATVMQTSLATALHYIWLHPDTQQALEQAVGSMPLPQLLRDLQAKECMPVAFGTMPHPKGALSGGLWGGGGPEVKIPVAAAIMSSPLPPPPPSLQKRQLGYGEGPNSSTWLPPLSPASTERGLASHDALQPPLLSLPQLPQAALPSAGCSPVQLLRRVSLVEDEGSPFVSLPLLVSPAPGDSPSPLLLPRWEYPLTEDEVYKIPRPSSTGFNHGATSPHSSPSLLVPLRTPTNTPDLATDKVSTNH